MVSPKIQQYLALVALLGTIAAQKPNTDVRRHDVYIAGFFPYGKGVENSETGRGVMPSVKLALDHVNEHSSILRNYRLHMWWNDTMCNAAVGVKAFFDMMHSGPHKLMLFGAACTHVTDPIAKASKHWHLTQLSYADTHPMFTKENFPNFFRIVPSENAFNPPRLSLLREFNWTRVGTIYQNEPRYSLAHNRLVAELDSLGYQVVETQSFTNEVTAALRKLLEKDTRVILGNFNERWGRQIFCEAYKLEMFGRRYQWVIMGTYTHNWWRRGDSETNCTVSEIEIALEQTILTDLLPLSTSGEITISGITADEYQMEYDSRRGAEYSRFHGYTYDGIWAVALAIQHVAHKVRYFKRNQTVVDFRYRDPLWEKLFLDALHNTSFEGVTGPVRFYDNERKAGILLKQFQEGVEIKVGEYSAATQHLDLTLGSPMKWIGKHPPKDRTLLIIEHTRVNKTVYAILASLAVCGIVMATVFLAFNIKYRNQRYIKMSSPQLNNLIIIGCILTYTSIVFLGLDSGLSSIEAFPYICTARAWTLMAGFSLAFGAMFSKTWRVHSIFTDVKLNKKVIKDYQLFMVVGVLLFIDLVIMTTWQVADPFYRETKQMEPYPHPHSEDIIIIPENEYCASERMTIFVGCIYAYKGLLMIFGAFLAWETRKVSIPALNDSRHVGLSVYNVAIMCICGAAVALVLVDHQDAMFLIISVFVLFCSTATLWLVFVPKMVELKRNPGGSIDHRIRATLRPMSKTRRDSSSSELETKMKDVKAANARFRKQLLDKESELQMLIKRLGNDAREIMNSRADSVSGDINRLSVPLLRKAEAPSATETSDITSLCSISSHDFVSLQHTDSQRRRKNATVVPPESPKAQVISGAVDDRPVQNGNLTKINTEYNKHLTNGATHDAGLDSSLVKSTTSVTVKTPTADRRSISNYGQDSYSDTASTLPRRCSVRSAGHQHHSTVDHFPMADDDDEEPESEPVPSVCHRRVSVPAQQQQASGGGGRQTPKRYGGAAHVVTKSELWDTGNAATGSVPLGGGGSSVTSGGSTGSVSSTGTGAIIGVGHRCGSKKTSRVSISQDSGADDDAPAASTPSTMHHRSVSERSRHGSVGGARRASSSSSPKHMPRTTSPAPLVSLPPPDVTSTASTTATALANHYAHAPVCKHHQQQQVVPANKQHRQPNKLAHHFQSTPNVAVPSGSDLDEPHSSVRHRGGGVGTAHHHHHHHHHHHSTSGAARDQQYHRGGSAHHPHHPHHHHHHRTATVSGNGSTGGGSVSGGGRADEGGKRDMYNSASESELLDREILPIFQKLLTERNKSQQRIDYAAFGRSCPNISIKCDIVEYL